MGSPHYDPFAYETHEDPYPIYKRLRDEAPAYYNARLDFWALSRYDDVRRALKDHETYCSGRGFVLEDLGDIGLPLVLGMDPPDHTRVRGTINRALTPRRVAALEAPIRALARRLLDGFAARGEADLMREFAAVLPLAVISEMLSVPECDRARLRTLADQMVHRDDATKGLPARGLEAARELAAYFEAMLQHRAATPRDDLLGILVAAVRAGEVSRLELLGFCFVLIIAGNETTAKLLGNAACQLTHHPAARARLLADRTLIPNAVEEVLRYDTSTHMMARTLTRDVELYGHVMPAGKKVALILASANRDERFWRDPDVFDVGRDTSGALALGLGLHHCLGAALARIEATVSLEEILARLPDFTVDLAGLERVHSGNVRGFRTVPITFTPAP